MNQSQLLNAVKYGAAALAISIALQAATDEKPSPIHYHTATAPVLAAAPATVKPVKHEQRTEPASVAGAQSGVACYYTGAEESLTAAHPSLPFGSRVTVTNLANGRSVVVTITDRGSFGGKRIISVNRRAAEELGFVNAGTAQVSVKAAQSDRPRI